MQFLIICNHCTFHIFEYNRSFIFSNTHQINMNCTIIQSQKFAINSYRLCHKSTILHCDAYSMKFYRLSIHANLHNYSHSSLYLNYFHMHHQPLFYFTKFNLLYITIYLIKIKVFYKKMHSIIISMKECILHVYICTRSIIIILSSPPDISTS